MRKPRIDVKQLRRAQRRKNDMSNLVLAIAGILALLALLFGIGKEEANYEDVYYDE